MAVTRTICCPCRTPSKPPTVTARKIREARDFLEVPIAVENVSSYAEFHVSEMTEWEFLNEVVEQRRLRHSAGREQHLRLVAEPRFRPLRIPERRARGARGADPHRRPFQIRKVYSGHARPSGDRPRVEAVRARHPARRRHRHAARMGRPHSQLRRSPRGGSESRQILARAGGSVR